MTASLLQVRCSQKLDLTQLSPPVLVVPTFVLMAWLLPLFFVPALLSCARLIDFQVTQPPPLPKDAKQCTVEILECVI